MYIFSAFKGFHDRAMLGPACMRWEKTSCLLDVYLIRTWDQLTMMSSSTTLLPPPGHPGKPQWQTFSDWNKTKTITDPVEMPMSEEDVLADGFRLHNIVDESNNPNSWGAPPEVAPAWGDNTNKDAGW